MKRKFLIAVSLFLLIICGLYIRALVINNDKESWDSEVNIVSDDSKLRLSDLKDYYDDFRNNVAPEDRSVKLQFGNIDTRENDVDLPKEWKARPSSENYIVQFRGVVMPEWRGRLDDIVKKRVGYVPNNAFIVKMNVAQRELVKNMGEVQWVGQYHPAYKISPPLFNMAEGDWLLVVSLFPGSEIADISSKVESLGGKVVSGNNSSSFVRIKINSNKLNGLASIEEVMWIEAWVEPKIGI